MASSKLNIHIALFICAVFISRALLLNISSFSTILKASQTPETSAHTAFKATASSEAAFHEHLLDSSQTDVFEEITDKQEDYLANIGSLAVLCIFYSFLTRLNFFLRPERLFDLIKCALYPKRFLSLSMLRI